MHTPIIYEVQEMQDPTSLRSRELLKRLEQEINSLIINDFEKLVFILYRVDVDEAKLRYLIGQNKNENTASIIANLLVERQLQKIEMKKKISSNTNPSDEERW